MPSPAPPNPNAGPPDTSRMQLNGLSENQLRSLAETLGIPWDGNLPGKSGEAVLNYLQGLYDSGNNQLQTLALWAQQGRITPQQFQEQLLNMAPDLAAWDKNRKMDPAQKNADNLAADLDAFAREMMSPLDMNDPTVRATIDNVRGAGQRAIGMTGAGGGMADAALAKGVGDAALGLHAQRQALGVGVMQNRLADQRQLNVYRDQAAQMRAEQQWQNQLAEWESNRGAGQMFGGLVGAGVGALPGIFTLNPALAVMGASAGYSLGAGVGASGYGGPPAKPVYNSPYYGGGMSSSGRMGY